MIRKTSLNSKNDANVNQNQISFVVILRTINRILK